MALLPVRAAVDTILQMGMEAVAGTRVPATKRIPGVSVSLNPEAEFELFRARGFKINTISVPKKFWANGTWRGIADYNSVIWPLRGLIGLLGSNPTTPAGATNARSWLFRPASSGRDLNRKTFTLEEGDDDAAQIAEGLQFQSFGLEWGNDSSLMSGNVFGLFPTDNQTLTASVTSNEIWQLVIDATSGDYDFTYGGDTVTIPFDASAAELLNFITDLDSVNVGDFQVSGGPGSSGGSSPYFIEGIGALAGTNLTPAVIDDTNLVGGGASGVLTTTQAGGGAGGVTNVPQNPCSRLHVDIFADDTFAAIGDTKVAQAYAGDFKIGDKLQPFWALNTDYTSYQGVVDTAADVTCSFSTPHNAQSRAFYNAVQSNPWKFIRLLATGPEIDIGINNALIRADVACKFGKPEKQEDENGVFGYKFNFVSLHNADMGRAYEIEAVNELTST